MTARMVGSPTWDSPATSIGVALRRLTAQRATTVVRITVHGDLGYLYLASGELVHATTLELEGEDAAVQILAWQDGVLEGCDRKPPARRTIFAPLSDLLARASDEVGGAPGRVVEAPVMEGLDPETPVHETESPWSRHANGGEAFILSTPSGRLRDVVPLDAVDRPPGGGRTWTPSAGVAIDRVARPPRLPHPSTLNDAYKRDDLVWVVRVATDGTILERRGDVDRAAAPLHVAFALADRIGALLGEGPVQAFEARSGDEHYVAVVAGDEQLVTRLHGGPLLEELRRLIAF